MGYQDLSPVALKDCEIAEKIEPDSIGATWNRQL